MNATRSTKNRKRSALTALLAAATFAVAGWANAGVIFTPGNNPEPNEENILFDVNPGDGLTVFGETQDSELLVFFTGLETLTTPAAGQARIEAVDGSFTDLTFGLVDGYFLDFILNPDFVDSAPPVDGSILVTVFLAGGGSAQYNFAVNSNGQNFLTIVATDGDLIDNINIQSSVELQFVNLSQPRISGAFGCPPGSTVEECLEQQPSPIPEPGTLALIGMGLLGLALVQRRRVRN